MVSALVLIPLLFASVAGIGVVFYVLKKKAWAQATCVQTAAQTQDDLRLLLRKLVRMNPQAKVLRRRRYAAEVAAKTAATTGYPPTIALAQAVLSEVIAEQMVFRARQEVLLRQAKAQRMHGKQRLLQALRALKVLGVRDSNYFPLALAVHPTPALDLTPDYLPVLKFPHFQQLRYRFDVHLFPPGLKVDFITAVQKTQATECSVSLKQKKEDDWKIQIIAASPASKP